MVIRMYAENSNPCVVGARLEPLENCRSRLNESPASSLSSLFERQRGVGFQRQRHHLLSVVERAGLQTRLFKSHPRLACSASL